VGRPRRAELTAVARVLVPRRYWGASSGATPWCSPSSSASSRPSGSSSSASARFGAASACPSSLLPPLFRCASVVLCSQ
jgi:hypothetical protein